MPDPTATIDVTIQRDRGHVTVAVAGELDVCTVPRLREMLTECIEARWTFAVSIDLHDVSFLDSTALGLFITFGRSLRARGGTLRLVNPTKAVRRAFEISGLDRAVTVTTAAA